MSRFSNRSLNNLKGVHPDLVRVMNEAIKDTPVDFTVTEGVRTTKRQQELYGHGRTTPGSIVTNADGVRNKSNHQSKEDGYGHAVDLYPYINGKVDVNAPISMFGKVANHIKEIGKRMGIRVEWGGDWKFTDYPHFEIKS